MFVLLMAWDLLRLLVAALIEELAEYLNLRVALCSGRRRTKGFRGISGLGGRVLCVLAELLWRFFPKEPLPARLREVVGPPGPCGCGEEK